MGTVLVAEPHPQTLQFVSELLQQAGHRVLAATTPEVAFELFGSERPDLVLLAVELPRLGGSHLGKLIRESEGGTRLPLVAIDKGHLGRALGVAAVLELRADAYFVDPTKPGLREKVEELLSRDGDGDDGVATVLARPPVAQGTIEPLSLLSAMVSWWRVGRDGILVTQQRDVERRVYLLGGRPIGFDSSSRADSIFRWLLERGQLTQALSEEAFGASARDGLSPGAALVAVGAIEPGEPLAELLRAYTRDRVARVLGAREGRYRLRPGNEHAGKIPVLPVPALACVLEALRHVVPARHAARILRPHLGSFPRRTAQFGEDLAELRLEVGELKLAMQISGRVRLSELLGSGRGELRTRYALLCALTLADDLEFAAAPAEARQYGEEHLVQRKRKPLPPELADEIREAALRAVTGSYFHVLGLNIGADTDAIERAYHEAATRFHPDRFAELDTGDLADLLASLQERLDAAYRVLASEEKRRAYVSHLLGRLEPRSRRHALQPAAEVELKRGEALLAADDAKGAAASFTRAIELNPREPEYFAYLAWAQFRGGLVGSVTDRAKDARRIVKKALAMEPENDRLLAILGILEAEAGDVTEGRRVLLRALRRNERNQLAKVALRRLNRVG